MNMTSDACVKCGEPLDAIPDATAAALVEAAVSGSPGSGRLCMGCFALWRQTNPAPAERIVPQRETTYRFTEDMGEISGFGGGYEQTCRNMLAAGIEWLDAHPDADPQFKGMRGVYGIINEENDDAKALSAAVIAAANGDCTGAMHQAVIGHCLFIKANGWEKYCAELRAREAEDEKAQGGE